MRRSPIRRRSPRRIEREAVFRPYVDWLHAVGGLCVVCLSPVNIQGSHVGEGGMGQKRGTAADMVRMCGPRGNDCHAQWEQRKLYFRDWDRGRRREAARLWRLDSWREYIKQAPPTEHACVDRIVAAFMEMTGNPPAELRATNG